MDIMLLSITLLCWRSSSLLAASSSQP